MVAMAAWWWWPLPAAWLLPGSTAAWFVVLNAVVCAIAVLSSRARESLSPRRASFSIFSFPSASLDAFQPDAELHTPTPRNRPVAEPGTPASPPYDAAANQHRSVPAPDTPPAQQPEREEQEEEEDYDEEEGNTMSMEEAYALVMAARGRPEPTEEEVSTSEVDAKAEEYIDEQRRQRLDSIVNYTQMLKQRAAAGRRPQQQQPAPVSGG